MSIIPAWVTNLNDEELNFIKQFVLSSGSIKAIALEYHVSYPTLRTRLNTLIEKIKLYDDPNNDSYITYIKQLAFEDKIDFEVAKELILRYRIMTDKGEI